MKKPKPSYMCKNKEEWMSSWYSYLESKYGYHKKKQQEQQEEDN